MVVNHWETYSTARGSNSASGSRETSGTLQTHTKKKLKLLVSLLPVSEVSNCVVAQK